MNKVNECTCPSGDGSLVHPCPAHPAVEQAGWDERAAFEAAFAAMGRPVCRADYDQDAYGTPFDDGGWTGWQARAALAQPSPKCATCNDSGQIVVSGPHYQGEFQPPEYETEPCDMCAQPSPAQAEQAEAERPEVVAYLFVKPDGTLSMDAVRHKPSQPAVAVMTVAQHERIVKAWIERWKAYIELSAKIAAQRDAALARVAELERQEPVALANRGLHAFWVKWTEAAAGLYGPGIKLYAAPVAQAQHSVPGDIMRDAQRYRWLRDQQFYFSFSTENSDAGISSCTAGMSSRFKNLSWVDAAIDSAIAAAPGKEVGHE
ncbi:hypothetical protein ACIUXC_05775 [Pseudomonas aeruginosa]|uniref:hypothetical protein n=1 Tax=Pseudomonas aeruginosa TaxID=287 RepID=UPI0015E66812|nr:hypothetical protein [Pseudomonas aeruginosa]